ncbi:hypothetical protein SAMN03159444_01368 [Pseudomonas sp. NFACC02]|nr:hypothetical protein SAMN03159444_01368 [Pseudomonas sp. NFACC02]
MECHVCNQAAEEGDSVGDYVAVDCTDCGRYRISGTVIGQLERGRWLDTAASQQWLEEQRRDGVESPLITTSNVVWDGVWVQG